MVDQMVQQLRYNGTRLFCPDPKRPVRAVVVCWCLVGEDRLKWGNAGQRGATRGHV